MLLFAVSILFTICFPRLVLSSALVSSRCPLSRSPLLSLRFLPFINLSISALSSIWVSSGRALPGFTLDTFQSRITEVPNGCRFLPISAEICRKHRVAEIVRYYPNMCRFVPRRIFAVQAGPPESYRSEGFQDGPTLPFATAPRMRWTRPTPEVGPQAPPPL